MQQGEPIPDPRPGNRRRFRRILVMAAAIYVGVLVVLMFVENWLIFPAPKYPQGNWQPGHVPVEDVFFESHDGTSLHGWYLAHHESTGYMLLCHGNGEHVAYLADELQRLSDVLRMSVFAFDYRGYGRSEGSPFEVGVVADAHAAHQWLCERGQVSPQQVVLMGRSLGGAIAVDLAAEHSARALILENTFTSMPDVAARLYWWAPVRWLMRTRLDSLAKIHHYSGPLLQSHGAADSLVPIEQGRALFEAASGAEKEFLEFGGGHNDPRPSSYYRKLSEFIARTAHVE